MAFCLQSYKKVQSNGKIKRMITANRSLLKLKRMRE